MFYVWLLEPKIFHCLVTQVIFAWLVWMWWNCCTFCPVALSYWLEISFFVDFKLRVSSTHRQKFKDWRCWCLGNLRNGKLLNFAIFMDGELWTSKWFLVKLRVENSWIKSIQLKENGGTFLHSWKYESTIIISRLCKWYYKWTIVLVIAIL